MDTAKMRKGRSERMDVWMKWKQFELKSAAGCLKHVREREDADGCQFYWLNLDRRDDGTSIARGYVQGRAMAAMKMMMAKR